MTSTKKSRNAATFRASGRGDEQVASTLQQQTNALRELSTSLAFDEVIDQT